MHPDDPRRVKKRRIYVEGHPPRDWRTLRWVLYLVVLLLAVYGFFVALTFIGDDGGSDCLPGQECIEGG
jgi:hypothetical protein